MNKKSGLVLRIALGLYLTYLGADLVRTVMLEKPTDMMMKAAMGIAFVVVGIWYAIWAVKGAWKLYKKENPDLEKPEEKPEKKEYNRPVTDKTKYRTAPMPGSGEIEQAMTSKSRKKDARVADETLELSDRQAEFVSDTEEKSEDIGSESETVEKKPERAENGLEVTKPEVQSEETEVSDTAMESGDSDIVFEDMVSDSEEENDYEEK